MKKFLEEYLNIGFSDDLTQGKAICLTIHESEETKEWSLLIKKNYKSHLILIDSWGKEEKFTIDDYLDDGIEVSFLEARK